MKVVLRVAGEQLLARLAAELARQDSAFPRQLAATLPLHWHLEALPSPFNSACLDRLPMQRSVILIEVQDESTLDALWSATCRDYPALTRDAARDDPSPPVMLAFARELTATQLPDMPSFVTDWVNGIDATHELALRVLCALRRLPRRGILPDSSRLSLAIDARRLWHGTDSVVLTPCEISVAELFLSRFGSVIPLQELQLLFRLAGRSVEGSNVRVAMFQLRFKIEALTHCHYTLTSAYGQGYVLKHGKAGDAGKSSQAWQQRQPA